MISRVLLVYFEQLPGPHRVSTFIPTLTHTPNKASHFPRTSKAFLVRSRIFTSDASEDVEAALEERTCIPIHSFTLLLLIGQWIPHLLKVLIGILRDGLGLVDGSNFQGGRGRAIVNRIIPGFLLYCLQFMLLRGSEVAPSSVVSVR